MVCVRLHARWGENRGNDSSEGARARGKSFLHRECVEEGVLQNREELHYVREGVGAVDPGRDYRRGRWEPVKGLV